MICKTALKHDLTYGRCGKCIGCRIDRQEEWTARMMFESYEHDHSVFVTLTYDEENVPDDLSVNRRDPTLWIKRLRKRLAGEDNPRKFRYFLCGEYGENHERPHYHAILFGCSLFDTQAIEETWGKGFVYVSEINEHRIRYTAKYVQKKVIKKGCDSHEDGRRSEFALMSRMPGLGQKFLAAMAHSLARFEKNQKVALSGLVRLDGRKYPLDRYGRNLLITALVDMGIEWRRAEEMVKQVEPRTEPVLDGRGQRERAEQAEAKQDKRIANAENRRKIFRQQRTRLH